MATLTYRGKAYIQHKEASQMEFFELTYRRNVYSNRRQEVKINHPILKYRGVSYQK